MPVPVKVPLSHMLLSGLPIRTAWALARGARVSPFDESCIRCQVRESRRWWWQMLPVF